MNSTRLLLIAVLLLSALLACKISGGDDPPANCWFAGDGSLVCTAVDPADATATYGAEQFRLQLTAISKPEQ
jgi:hypothetical protein